MTRGLVVALLASVALTACEPRRDVADMAVGMQPFEELRGMGLRTMRSGGVRAFRRNVERAPFEGLREQIGAFDVVYEVPGYVGIDSTWPSEDSLIESVEASREWPSDSLALGAYDRAVSEYRTLSQAAPTCLRITGKGFSMRIAEWALGDGYSFTASYAPGSRLANGGELSARHAMAVRRRSVQSRFPQAGAANPDDHPTWQTESCDAGQ